ncbi:MAG: chain length determinant protein EpsF [Burkholderiales bacterium]|jgi:chain length determinant protein EpsF|nr:chain length determinant protein EpsF [Burkholderiales bacterium]HJQ64691.1 chain length determinant protein EpsF [Burkholderiales bacterium]
MNIQQLLIALRARPGVFALVLAATVFTTLVVSLLLPKSYVATASLLLDSKDEQSMGNGNPLVPALLQQQQQAAYMQTQTDIIRSYKVVHKVVRDLGLANNPVAREEFEEDTGGAGSFENWLADRLLQWLKVETSQSSVVQISYTAKDARFAAQAANAFAKAYLDTTLELRVEPTQRTAVWFDEQLKGLRASLEDAQAKLTEYQRQKKIVVTNDRMDVEEARLAELSTYMVTAQNAASEADSRERLARQLLGSGGAAADKVPEVLANSYIQRLKSELALSEAKLKNLSADLGANHPQLQRQRAEYESLRAELRNEMSKIVAGLANAARQARQHEAQLRNAMAEQRGRVLELKDFQNEIGVLARNVDSAQRAYDSAMQRFVVSKVESGANRTNVSVLDAAVEPSMPARPRIPLNVALSVVMGTMLALAVVFFMEQFDRRVRSLDDLAIAEVPLLAQLNEWQPAQGLLGRPSGRGWALPAPG